MALRRNSDKPTIENVSPVAAIPGGDFLIHGKSFAKSSAGPTVTIGDRPASLIVGSDTYLVARVPEGTESGDLVISNGDAVSDTHEFPLGVQLADSLHPVTSPVVDVEGNVFTTFSGSRGQKTPVAVYRIDRGGNINPFLTDVMNATGLAFDSEGVLHISSRFEGIVYQSTSTGIMSVFVEGMGVATGIAFDAGNNLYVGDRSGTIFKIAPSRQIYVFATLEPSISAYHLAIGPDDSLYVTGPTTSSHDAVYRITANGEVSTLYRGLGRPQGMAFDQSGRLYVAASLAGRKGIVRFTPEGEPQHFLSGPNIVGLAFDPRGDMLVTTTSALYRVEF